MDPISIYFFVLASIIGLESRNIASQKARFTINPVERTFEIHQEDLFSIVMTAEDSLIVAQEMQRIAEYQQGSEKKSNDVLIVDEIKFSNTNNKLNATVKGRYSNPIALEEAGIHLDSMASKRFNLMNFPDWNIRSSQAVLKENYWSWPSDKTVTITLEPYQDTPSTYRQYRRSVLPYWEQLNDN